MATSNSRVGIFFDEISEQYNEAIDRCVPRYREMLDMLFRYLPADREYGSILELGCGTGNLSELLARRFPKSKIQFVDLSADSLHICRSRLGEEKRLVFEQGDFRSLSYPAGAFDLVISSIAVHHLRSIEKQDLFKRVNRWLGDDGVFTYGDQFSGVTQDLYQRHMEQWKACALELGSTEEDWKMWMEHQSASDHHESLPDQLGWLGEAGFRTRDCVWRYLLWTVVQARK